MKALILAAGSGSNLIPFTSTRPKPMINVGGGSILENAINMLKKVGVRDILMIVGHEKEKITEYFGGGEDFDINIHYHEQKVLNGIGEAVLLGKGKFMPGEYFMLIYSDIVTSSNIYLQILQSFNSFKSPVASICLPPSSEMFGNVFLDSRVNITKVIEKPKTKDMGNYVLAGIFILPTEFFNILEENSASMEDALSCMVSKGGLKASIWEDDWIDIIYPWDILSANKMIMDSWDKSIISRSVKIENNVTINGPVILEDDVIIKSGAVLDGPCFLGKGCYVGNNSLIRKYTALGNKSIIGYGVELKNCIAFGNSNVGRLSFVGDSIVGENVEIGAGSVTVNRNTNMETIGVRINDEMKNSHLKKLGSFIGDNVKIGAANSMSTGTIIPSGTRIPNNCSYPS